MSRAQVCGKKDLFKKKTGGGLRRYSIFFWGSLAELRYANDGRSLLLYTRSLLLAFLRYVCWHVVGLIFFFSRFPLFFYVPPPFLRFPLFFTFPPPFWGVTWSCSRPHFLQCRISFFGFTDPGTFFFVHRAWHAWLGSYRDACRAGVRERGTEIEREGVGVAGWGGGEERFGVRVCVCVRCKSAGVMCTHKCQKRPRNRPI